MGDAEPCGDLDGAGVALGLDELVDLLEVILEETRRLNGLVTDFLTFGRPPTPALATVSHPA